MTFTLGFFRWHFLCFGSDGSDPLGKGGGEGDGVLTLCTWPIDCVTRRLRSQTLVSSCSFSSASSSMGMGGGGGCGDGDDGCISKCRFA